MLLLLHMYHTEKSKLWSLCCYINCAVIAVRAILQIAGIYDLRETLLLTHICLLLFVIVIVGTTIHGIATKELTSMVKINSICVMVIMVSTVLELMEQARESALYRKLAFTDELTGLANRTAFREDLEKRMEPDKATGEEKIMPTVVYMFDLNDLKKCNDTYGHDYGDQYIKMAADALKKIFVEDGKCYRIGGDGCYIILFDFSVSF